MPGMIAERRGTVADFRFRSGSAASSAGSRPPSAGSSVFGRSISEEHDSGSTWSKRRGSRAPWGVLGSDGPEGRASRSRSVQLPVMPSWIQKRSGSRRGSTFYRRGSTSPSLRRLSSTPSTESIREFTAEETALLIRKWRTRTKILLAWLEILRKSQQALWKDPLFHEQTKTIDRVSTNSGNQDERFVFFDPSEFKANKQMRVTPGVKSILESAPENRSEHDVYYAMIALRAIPTIADYPLRMQMKLAKYGSFESFVPGRVIVRQGRSPEAFYFILYGTVIVAVTDLEVPEAKTKCYLHRGHTFGELSIMNSSCRQSTVITKSYVELLSIDVQSYQTIFMIGGVKDIYDPDHHEFIKNLLFLKGWPLELLEEHPQKVIFCYFKGGSVLVKDSNFSDWIYIIKSGSVQVLKKLLRCRPDVNQRTGRSLPTSRLDYNKPSVYALNKNTPRGRKTPLGDLLSSMEDLDDEEMLPVPESDLEPCEGPRGSHVTRVHSALAMISRKQRGLLQTGSAGKRPRNVHSAGGSSNGAGNDGGTRETSSKRKGSQNGSGSPQPRRSSSVSKNNVPNLAEILKAQDTETQETLDFKEERRTFLDDLNPVYQNQDQEDSPADKDPAFVHVQTLTRGDVFGLAPLFFPDQPSLSLVSNGAECILINKSLYLQHCPRKLSELLKHKLSPYPSDQKLQEDLLTSTNWKVYKKVICKEVLSSRKVKAWPVIN